MIISILLNERKSREEKLEQNKKIKCSFGKYDNHRRTLPSWRKFWARNDSVLLAFQKYVEVNKLKIRFFEVFWPKFQALFWNLTIQNFDPIKSPTAVKSWKENRVTRGTGSTNQAGSITYLRWFYRRFCHFG